MRRNLGIIHLILFEILNGVGEIIQALVIILYGNTHWNMRRKLGIIRLILFEILNGVGEII